MTHDLTRLLNPGSIAVIGGGAWCTAILGAAHRIGFRGDIFPVHPDGKEIAGVPALRCLQDRQGPIDAAFIGINRHATLAAVEQLRALDAGGAVCFASGFTEAQAEDGSGVDLQARLVATAGSMPILGPNCYGFINALDRVAIWPDQHGMQPVEQGVAILTQSSNIAINMTMQARALPIAMMVTCGNMAQIRQADLALAMLEDPRITAIGLHIEGFGDLRIWETLAEAAHRKGVPLVALKIGRSDQAKRAAISHTASLAGSDAGAQAFLDRLGIARLFDLPSFLETLKLMHLAGRLESNRIASISCSGGEASLIADMAVDRDLEFPALTANQSDQLKQALGPMVALANPLDYHTYVWRDTAAMTKAWSAMTDRDIAMTLSIVDYPTTDAADWTCATQSALAVHEQTGRPFGVVSTLPELMPPDVAATLMAGGVVPLFGLNEALAALEAAARSGVPQADPVLLPTAGDPGPVLSEVDAKQALAEFGMMIPRACVADTAEEAGSLAQHLTAPLAVKGMGLAHKSESGAVRLGVKTQDVEAVARDIATCPVLIEEMVTGGVAELLIGVTCDPANGYVLTLAAGGVLTELLQDSVSLLVPASTATVSQALSKLRCYPLLTGYRGKPAADMYAILRAIQSLQDYVIANANTVAEVEINPLICTPKTAVAADALIRMTLEKDLENAG